MTMTCGSHMSTSDCLFWWAGKRRGECIFFSRENRVASLPELCWSSSYTHPNKSSSQRNPKTPAEGRRRRRFRRGHRRHRQRALPLLLPRCLLCRGRSSFSSEGGGSCIPAPSPPSLSSTPPPPPPSHSRAEKGNKNVPAREEGARLPASAMVVSFDSPLRIVSVRN
jgi:hypothetical protein